MTGAPERRVSPRARSAFGHYRATNHARAAEYVVHDARGDVIAARWRRPASHTIAQTVLAQHTLMYHIGGATSVAKFVDGRCVGTRAQHGTLTFCPRDESSEWIRGGVCEVMHIYIAPSMIRSYAEESLPGATTPHIDPLFAVNDPWLQSYFRLMQSELEIYGGDSKHPEALLLTQSMELLVRHLLCWHSDLSRHRQQAALAVGAHPLAPRHLARVLDYIEVNIADDIALADLAALVGVSKYNFIRSFRAATQQTPYAYLVDRRLARAVAALRYSMRSVARIGRDAGFKSTPGFSNVFKKHFGVSPSEFRARSA